ncbi:MAG: potassium channel protein [Desulfobacterales bacterium CG07_land_8_20_14_0_80_52_14]|nr:MAG: potassium channel protein [Desulfobacterales bacterium CG23_combo_of_CG06-09_8_20_14_all_52_9]PIU50143.1 MAG: potassium channel protein [Desulfobacterales bacterium CG07_land_8_20_14_0_80_52_14]
MKRTRHLLWSLVFGAFIIFSGTCAYMFMEGWDFMDSLFMTVTTLSTVGYGEVRKLTNSGRAISMVLIFVGVGYFFYVAGAVIQFMMEGQIRNILGRRRLEKKIERLKSHYIVCGYGRIGRILVRNILRRPLDVVVIEKDKNLLPVLEQDSILYISGDASEEANLIKAGIGTARGLVAVLSSDADNVFLVLTARQLNPDLFILARATADASKAKLEAAGADIVESPYDIGAVAMAHRVVRPTVSGFLDLALAYKGTDIQMEEIPVSPDSELVNVMLKDSGIRQKYDLIIIAVKDSAGNMRFNPSFETTLCAGDTVIAIGGEKNLRLLGKALSPS